MCNLKKTNNNCYRYKIGEVFVFLPQPEALEKLEKATELIDKDIEESEDQIENILRDMNKLKGLLYGKFGNSINLEA